MSSKLVEQIYPPPHIIVQTWLYNNWPDDGSVDPKRSDIRWGEEWSGQSDICLIVEGGAADSRFVNNGDTLRINKQQVRLHAYVRDTTGNYPDQIRNMRAFIKRFIRLNHSSDELDTWNVDYVAARRMFTAKLVNNQLSNVYRLRMFIDVIYMTQIIV